MKPAELSSLLGRYGVSGRELARRLDVSPMWVSRRETGVVVITPAERAAILEALRVEIALEERHPGGSFAERFPTTEVGGETRG